VYYRFVYKKSEGQMGNANASYLKSSEAAPNIKADPTFDPLYGFSNGRTERRKFFNTEFL